MSMINIGDPVLVDGMVMYRALETREGSVTLWARGVGFMYVRESDIRQSEQHFTYTSEEK